ncbi:MAG: 4Fe-4S cluster-binding domain-containing protein [Collinsella sp.]|nr:4Fe-4S cluster-binding domain-containing protein [Collinsella sp.]
MSIQLSRIASPVTSLGPGRYIGLWVQGCSIGCPDCVSKDTWDKRGGSSVDEHWLSDLIIETIRKEGLEGVVVTGGEPTEQADSLEQVLASVVEALPGTSIIVFSGIPREKLLTNHPGLSSLVDLAVCGPYISDLPSQRPLIASENQEYAVCSNRGSELLAKASEMADMSGIQVAIDGNSITMAGLPFPHGMELLEEELQNRGIVFSEVSWKK